MQILTRIVIFIFFLLYCIRTPSILAVVNINHDDSENIEHENITNKIEIAESSPSLQIGKEDLDDPDILSFKTHDKNFLSFPYSKKTRWVKFHLINNLEHSVTKYIVFTSPLSGSFFVIDSKAILLEEIGSSIPGKNYQSQLNLPFYKVKIAPNESKVLYWALRSRHNGSGEFYLSDSPKDLAANQNSLVWFYVGGILTLIFLNILTYIFTREPFYRYYLIYALSFLIFVLMIKGKLDEFIYFPNLTLTHFTACFSTFLTLNAVLFSQNFLKFNFKANIYKYFHNILLIILIVLLFVSLTPLYDWFIPFSGLAVDISIVLSVFHMIFMGLLSLKENKVFGTIYLMSWSFIFIGVFTWFGMKIGFLPGSFITQNILLFANLLEMTTLALGLSLKQIEWQKEKTMYSQKIKENEKFERLLRVLTHDLSNPLTLILGNTKKLLTRDELTFDNPALEKISIAAENIRRIITKIRQEELLNLSPESSSQVLVVDTIKYSMIFFEEQFQQKNLRVELNLNKSLTLLVDRTILVNNIFNNIFSNAIKFSPFGGTIKIDSFSTEKEIIIDFRDYGSGISKDTLDQFNNQEKIISTNGTNNEEGSGFGLYLIRDYMSRLNGSMQIESYNNTQNPKESGTRVRLIFPLEKKSR